MVGRDLCVTNVFLILAVRMDLVMGLHGNASVTSTGVESYATKVPVYYFCFSVNNGFIFYWTNLILRKSIIFRPLHHLNL